MSENYTVYMHRFPNGKVYIGMTSKKPEDRWERGSGYRTQNVFKAILKYGWDNIEHIVLFDALSKDDAEKKEIELIKLYQSSNPKYGYNIDLGGNYAGKHSAETCEKISASKKGWNPSEETRRRMSEAKKGKPLPESTRQKLKGRLGRPLSEKHRLALLKANIGRIVSEETRKKQSDAHKGKTLPEEQKRKISESGKIAQRKCKAVHVVQISMDGERLKVWECMSDITRELGINSAHICACCRGQRNQTGGYRWMYADK